MFKLTGKGEYRMIKAFFLDFYGTVVHEDGQIIKKIANIISDTSSPDNLFEIGAFWWNDFFEMFSESYGDKFETQRVIEEKSLRHTIEKFGSTADSVELSNLMFEHWRKPPIFEDSKEFFDRCPIPVYILSNIDNTDIDAAVAFHGLKPAGVFTSEDARSYKPRRELFELALSETGLKPDEVIHIGDSISSDVEGAGALGIRTLWINRFGKRIPEGVESITSLPEALTKIDVDY